MPEDTAGILLAMEKGGAGQYFHVRLRGWDPSLTNGLLDIIELGNPFTDPIADGPTIQTSNTVSGASSAN